MRVYSKILGLAFSVFCLYSCAEDRQEDNHEHHNIFKYNESAGLTTLDPARVTRFEDFLVVDQLFDGLIGLNSNMEVVPELAKGWEISGNGKVYTFHLRTNAKFHKSESFADSGNRKVTAQDVVYTFNRILDPLTASPAQYIFANIARNEQSKYKGILAPNDSTVVIHLEEKQPSFIYQLSLPNCGIVPPESIDFYASSFGENPVGTGPFKMTVWKRNSKLVLAKNEEYYQNDLEGNNLPYLDGISISFIKDRHSEFLRFKNGDLDMISGLNEDEKDDLLDVEGNLKPELEEGFYLQKQDWLNTDYLGILVDERLDVVNGSPLGNKNIRQAIGYALDVESLIKYLRNNIGTPATKGFIPEGMPGFEEYAIEGFSYDLDKARALLNEAGYNSPSEVPKITLVANAEYAAMCGFIQNNLNELGLDVEIDIQTASLMKQSIAQFDANFYRKSWIADYPDAINYFQLFYSKNFYPESGVNYTHFKDNTFDELYELALVEDSAKLRYEYYKDMQLIIKEKAPVIPLFYAQTLRFLSKKVSGLQGNSLNMLDLRMVRKN